LLRVPVALLLATLIQGGTQAHLLDGVRHFREGRYAEALVEFRVIEKAPDAPPDLAFYLGPTLYKLGRFEEALKVFVRAPERDALTDFYLGQTYYQLKLYRKAREVFVALRSRGLGPKLAEAAGRYVAEVDRAYQSPPSDAVVDAYFDEGRGAEPTLAVEYLEEAQRVVALNAHHHHADEIALALARAYVALGNAPRARPLLQTLVAQGGPRATEARAILSGLK
jgi:tetratricopeptide (TPR) repeat protein